MSTRNNTIARNKNNWLCLAVADTPCLYPEGVYSTDELNAEMIGRQGRKKTYPECILHRKKVFRWLNGEPTAAAPEYDSRGRKEKAKARVKDRGSQRTEAKSEPEPEFGNEEDGEFEHESEYSVTTEPVNRRSPLPTTVTMKELEYGIYTNENIILPPASRQSGEGSSPEQQAIALTETPQERRSTAILAPCCSTKPPRSALAEALANMPPPKELSIEEKIDVWLQFRKLHSLFPLEIQSPKDHIDPGEKTHQSPQPTALPAFCAGSERVFEETDMY